MSAERGLETLSTPALLDRLHAGSAAAVDALAAASGPLSELVSRLVDGWREGGRLIYVGAGTSGRIGALDAAECEPTFGVPPGRVLALMAGGDAALRAAVEGAEDDEEAALAAVEELKPTAVDLLVGISASGSTPFTCAALEHAAKLGARTGAFTGRASCRLATAVQLPVVLEVGEELVEGSTRLAAGTAQKLACNALTTAAFVRLGRVRGRHMVAVRPTNRKLQRRAVAILQEVLSVEADDASAMLRACGEDLPCALVAGAGGVDATRARTLLQQEHGDVGAAIAAATRERTR